MSGVVFVLLLGAAIAALALTSRGGGGSEVKAEFTDAFPLLEGMHVRVSGAVAGSVDEIELTEDGTALVTMHLHAGLERPRRDATASIRQEDLLGDNYLSLSLGDDPDPLEDTIPTSRTSIRPRLDDVMNVFRRPVRAAVETMLVELGRALEQRGEDLNTAVVELRPALEAADRVTTELGSQNAALRDLIADAQRVTSQAARGSKDLGRMVDAFAGTVRTTAAHASALDRGLDTMPETLVQARSTLARLTRTADAARPLAASLADVAPGLTTTARLLDPFLDDAAVAVGELRPTLQLTRRFLTTAGPTLGELTGGLRTLQQWAPPGDRLMDAFLPAMEGISDSVFGAKHYGFGSGRFGETGLGATSVELGNQPGDPFADPARHYNRSVGVASCETVGYRIERGCLDAFLEDFVLESERTRRERPGSAERRPQPAPAEQRGEGRARVPDPRRLVPRDRLEPDLGEAPRPEDLKRFLDFVLGP